MVEMSSDTVKFGPEGTGFLATPVGEGPFPGAIVVQEWWGLDDHIRDVAQRFAGEGFVTLAPDLYHGAVAAEPSEAQKLMMALDMNRAATELTNAAEFLSQRTAGRGIGAIGFCMGGGLALTLACDSEHIRAVAPFYGVNPSPIEKIEKLSGPVFAVYAEHDQFAGTAVRQQLEEALTKYGKKHEVKVYPGTQHAFFNDTRKEVHNETAAKDAWTRTIALFKENL